MFSLFRLRRTVSAFLALILMGVSGPMAHAAKGKWTPGENVSKAVGRVIGAAQAINQNFNYGFDSFCFSGSLIRQGGQTIDNLPLQGGTTYILVGAGDDFVQDLDIVLKDTAGRPTGKHRTLYTKAGPVHLVQYKPVKTGDCRLALRLRKARVSAAFCAYAILRNDGLKVPLQNLITSVTKCMTMCANVAHMEGGARLHQSRHGAIEEFSGAVVAKVLRPGQADGFGGTLEKGRHAFVVATDREDNVIGAGLVDTNRNVVAKRIGQGAMKCPTQDKMYALAIQNGSRTNDILAVAAVIDLPPQKKK